MTDMMAQHYIKLNRYYNKKYEQEVKELRNKYNGFNINKSLSELKELIGVE